MPSRTGQRVGPRTRIAEFMLREAIDGPSDEEWTAPEGDDTEADVEKGRSRGAPSSRHGVLHDSEGRTQRDVLKEPGYSEGDGGRAPLGREQCDHIHRRRECHADARHERIPACAARGEKVREKA